MIRKMIALDWRAMKYYQIRGLLLPLFALIFGIVGSSIMVIPICAFMCMAFSVNPFAVEEKGELNNLYLTLPIKRKQIVAGRYALSLLIFLAGLVFGVVIMAISNVIATSKWFVGVEGVIVIAAFSFFFYAIANLFTFPTLFLLGYQKGKLWGFYVPVILFSMVVAFFFPITMAGTFLIDLITYASQNMLLVSGGLIVLGAALLFLSYTISVKLYSKRSF